LLISLYHFHSFTVPGERREEERRGEERREERRRGEEERRGSN